MKRSNSFATIPAMLLGIVLGIFAGLCSMPAFAVDHSGAFELEGNATENDYPGDDWETLNNGGGSQTTFTGIIDDRDGSDDDIYTGGKSKVPELIEDWHGNPVRHLPKRPTSPTPMRQTTMSGTPGGRLSRSCTSGPICMPITVTRNWPSGSSRTRSNKWPALWRFHG